MMFSHGREYAAQLFIATVLLMALTVLLHPAFAILAILARCAMVFAIFGENT